jgi:glycine cleavage system H protein
MFSRVIPRIINNNSLKMTRILNKRTKTYTANEEWILEKICSTEIGLTNKAIEQLGEIVYIDFPNTKGDIIKENDELVTIESVKATESINAPFECIVLKNNTTLEEDLQPLNENPEDTWIIKIDKLH